MLTMQFSKLSKAEIESVRNLLSNAITAIDEGTIRDVGDLGFVLNRIQSSVIESARDHQSRWNREDQLSVALDHGVDPESVRKLNEILSR